MSRLVSAAAAALLLALSSSATALAIDSGQARTWVSPVERAMITSCLTGNSGTIDRAQPDKSGTRITGQMRFCRDDGAVRNFGLEFFANGVASGYFIEFAGQAISYTFIGGGFWTVEAICVSAAPNDRLACARVSVDGTTGVVSLTPIPVTDPAVAAPSGAMRSCDSPGGLILHPTCATCV